MIENSENKENQKLNDEDLEIHFYEGILKSRPDFLQAMSALADLYTKKGWYQKGLELDKKLAQKRPEDPVILYNLACSYSLVGEIDKAFSVLKLAVQSGYDDFKHLEDDLALTNLRKDTQFQTYFEQTKKKISETEN